MGGSFEKICITVSFELGIIRITGACHLLCCVAFDLLYSAYLQSLCNILLVLLSLIHVNVIEILEEAATELTAAADKMAATMLLLQVFSNYLPIGFCKF